MKKAYRTNSIFKEYVDKYSIKHNISVDVALTHLMVKNYYEYLIHEGKIK